MGLREKFRKIPLKGGASGGKWGRGTKGREWGGGERVHGGGSGEMGGDISKISKKLIGLITTYGAYFWHKHHKFCKLLIECLANNFISQYKSI